MSKDNAGERKLKQALIDGVVRSLNLEECTDRIIMLQNLTEVQDDEIEALKKSIAKLESRWGKLEGVKVDG